MKLETKRLIIRKATLEDAEFFLKLLNEPGYIQMIRDSQVRNLNNAIDFIEEYYLKSYLQQGFGLYILEEKKSMQKIGVTGFVKRDGLECVDLGFACLDKFSGKGFIQEASQAVLNYGFTKFSLKKIAAITTDKNIASQKILTNLGFKKLNKIILKEIEFDYFEINFESFINNP